MVFSAHLSIDSGKGSSKWANVTCAGMRKSNSPKYSVHWDTPFRLNQSLAVNKDAPSHWLSSVLECGGGGNKRRESFRGNSLVVGKQLSDRLNTYSFCMRDKANRFLQRRFRSFAVFLSAENCLVLEN